MKKLGLAILCILLFTGYGAATSIGAVPSSIDFGQVNPGESIEQPIYITVRSVSSQENFTITPSANGIGAGSLFTSERFDNQNEISEQPSEDWWGFEEATVGPRITVDGSELDMSALPELNGVSRGTLEVPENAEPGLRYGYINLNANPPQNARGAGNVGFVSPTRIRYSFYVSGNPERNLVVQDVRGFRTDTNRASVEVLLTNEGTVTTSSQDFEIDVLDGQGDNSATLEVSGLELEPGESEWTNAVWFGGDVDEGTYQIDGQVDYFTGSAYASGSFSLGDIVTVEEAPSDSPVSDGESERDTVPMWLVFMVLAILAVLMWSFDIEPSWILAIVGGLAISAFILLSGVSNYLLVVLLMAVGIVVYGVM